MYICLIISLICCFVISCYIYYKYPKSNTWNKKIVIETKEKIQPSLIKYRDGFMMYIYSDKDIVSNRIKKTGVWIECEFIFNLWKQLKLIKMDGYFVDVGANIGSCSLKMLYHGVKTISFEPVHSNLNLFTKSLLYNKMFLQKIELYTIGLSNETKTLPMYINKDSGGSSFFVNWSKNLKGVTNTKLYTLDDIYHYNENILLMKIDVEGYEYNVLQGARNLLKSHKIKIVYIEINCYGLLSVGMNENYVYNILKEYKYNISKTPKCKGYDLFDIYGIADDFHY